MDTPFSLFVFIITLEKLKLVVLEASSIKICFFFKLFSINLILPVPITLDIFARNRFETDLVLTQTDFDFC